MQKGSADDGARLGRVFKQVEDSHHSERNKTQVIRAELIGDDSAVAPGITARSSSPVVQLCTLLIEAGHDPAARLEIYRGEMLCLRVRSIGEGARLAISSHGSGFRWASAVRTASPIEKTGEGVISVPDTASSGSQADKPVRPGEKRTGLAAIVQVAKAKGGRGKRGGISEAARRAGISRYAAMRAAKPVRVAERAGKGSDGPKPVLRRLSANGGR